MAKKAKDAFPSIPSYACRPRASALRFSIVQLRRVVPLEVISQGTQKGIGRLSGFLALCLSGQPNPPALFLLSSSVRLGLEVISRDGQKGKGRLSVHPVLCLSPQGKRPPLFYCPAPAGCAPRGHKSRNPKRHRTPFRVPRLMLVGAAQPACAFLIIPFSLYYNSREE